MKGIFREPAAVALCILMAGCGGGGYSSGNGGSNGGNNNGSNNNGGGNGTTTTINVGGSISGLSGMLQLRSVLSGSGSTVNSTTITSRTTNGAFSISAQGNIGGTFALTIDRQPDGQLCSVTGGNGSIASANVTGINISCMTTSTPAGVAAQLSAGLRHTCALLGNSAVKCWGDNSSGQLGAGAIDGYGSRPGEMGANLPVVNLGTGRSVVQLAAGGYHTCARFDDGSVKCWGAGGLLGLGDGNTRGTALSAADMGDNLPALDLGGRPVVQLATGGDRHTCALFDNGTVKCWGLNLFGQLGLGDDEQRGDGPNEMGASLPTVDLGTGLTAAEITVGFSHTCARLNNGAVKCWGSNNRGQLGIDDVSTNFGDDPGEMGDNLPVVNLGAGRTAVALTAGQRFTCALLDDSTVRCWGNNDAGQLGLGDTTVRTGAGGAVAFGAGLNAVQLVAGRHACARLNNGSVKCWGAAGLNGQLGLGDTRNRGDMPGQMGDNLPQVDLSGRVVLQITTHAAHTCVRLDDDNVKCWGANALGQLGIGAITDRGDQPNEMGDNLPIVNLVN